MNNIIIVVAANGIFYLVLHFSYFVLANIDKKDVKNTIRKSQYILINYPLYLWCLIFKKTEKKKITAKIKEYLPNFISFF